MAFDLMKGRAGGRDWSCGIGDAAPARMPTAAIFTAGAIAVGATLAGVFAASSIGGRPAPAARRPMGTTVMYEPTRGGSYVNKLGGRR